MTSGTTTDDWHLTDDVGQFLARGGEFLRSRPVPHTILLTVTENLRLSGDRHYGDAAPEFGLLDGAGGAGTRAAFLRTPPHPLLLTVLTEEEAAVLAARLADAGREVSGVTADRDTAAAFAGAWRRITGAEVRPRQRMRLYRLGELTVPRQVPPGRAGVAGEADHERLARWFEEFSVAVGEPGVHDPQRWADERVRRGDVMFWQDPDGTPVAMAGTTPKVAGQVRVVAVYTPAHLRGRGYAGAVTVEVSRAALESGAEEVLLFADLANPTSNGLYQRIGYRPVSDFAMYDFG
ncbi:GNAT family N-acetyltransferase [Streptomyces sp. NPDC058451]|uniref:GNAT family N-acetyltransferase n=1 Tax=Streptomyces sp. NPDC058451 TaxID=3346506 RepID=UPI0036564E23